MKEYSSEVLKKLTAAIRGDKDSQQWLVDNNYRELSEFWDAYEDMENSFQWLKNNGYVHFAATVDAMGGNEKAKVWLMQNGYRMLAALSDASEGNKTAVMWMLKLNHKDWLNVAKAIYDYNNKKKKKGFLWTLLNLGNPYA